MSDKKHGYRGDRRDNEERPKVKSYTEFAHPAICIPRSVVSMTPGEIEKQINKTGLGVVRKVVVKNKTYVLNDWEQFVEKEKNVTEIEYSNIYIYFEKWNVDDPKICEYRNRLLQGNSIKIVFESIPTPVFWRCVAARF